MRSPTVLCVDDAETILGFYEELLGKYGYEVIAASNGDQALELFHLQAEAIDAVIVDYEMPGMNGLELAILLKGHTPTLPIFMISGAGPELDEMSPFIDAAIAKGVSIRDIMATLDVLIAKRTLQSHQDYLSRRGAMQNQA